MPTQGVGEVIIAKHRNGSLDTVQLKFIGKYTKFTDLDMHGDFDGGGYASFPATSQPNEFEAGPNTITLGSKLNTPNKPSIPDMDDDEAPF